MVARDVVAFHDFRPDPGSIPGIATIVFALLFWWMRCFC